MRNSRLTLALILAAGTLPVACSRDDAATAEDGAATAEDGAATAEDGAATAELAPVPSGDSLTGPVALEAPDAAQRPERIYYDLTEFDWYARGEPLVHEGMAYDVAAGYGLVALDARTLENVGEYGGVDVYRRDADPHVYVPVYEGWWLRFAPGATLPAGAASDSGTAADTGAASADTSAAPGDTSAAPADTLAAR